MKKTVFMMIAAFGLLAMSCSEESEVTTNNSRSFTTKSISDHVDTDTISTTAYAIGATRFVVKGNIANYVTEGRTFTYIGSDNVETISLDSYKFEFDDTTVRIAGSDNYLIRKDNVDYFVMPDLTVRLDEPSNGILDKSEPFILTLAKNELDLLSGVIKDPSTQIYTYKNPPINIGMPCSFGDQYFAVGMGFTEAGATSDLAANFNEAVADGLYEGCTQIGGIEDAPLTFGRVKMMTFCCP